MQITAPETYTCTNKPFNKSHKLPQRPTHTHKHTYFLVCRLQSAPLLFILAGWGCLSLPLCDCKHQRCGKPRGPCSIHTPRGVMASLYLSCSSIHAPAGCIVKHKTYLNTCPKCTHTHAQTHTAICHST